MTVFFTANITTVRGRNFLTDLVGYRADAKTPKALHVGVFEISNSDNWDAADYAVNIDLGDYVSESKNDGNIELSINAMPANKKQVIVLSRDFHCGTNSKIKLIKDDDFVIYYVFDETLPQSIKCNINIDKFLQRETFTKKSLSIHQWGALYVKNNSDAIVQKLQVLGYAGENDQLYAASNRYNFSLENISNFQVSGAAIEQKKENDISTNQTDSYTYRVLLDKMKLSWEDEHMKQLRDVLLIVIGGLFGVVTTLIIEIVKGLQLPNARRLTND